MRKSIMLIAAMCMTSVMTFAQKTIRVSTDKTDLVMKVFAEGPPLSGLSRRQDA